MKLTTLAKIAHRKTYPTEKQFAALNRWQKGHVTRRRNKVAKLVEICCAPNPLFDDIVWTDAPTT